MPRTDPHEGKTPGQGCGCPKCREPHSLEIEAVVPGTPEHETFVAQAAEKRSAAEAAFAARGVEIGRPKHWR